ncbi:alpha-COP [Reticulomyxa filosa]|uniref:Alpha-COP n=1 Tax=Reticulomyxa filosa TaxID=46433 RepID=X6MUC9_RETFI|nr:alpha-COP [Reticulomyxa filosa]|eukprot:ETO16725.1 alpha-COP [Reticulomyxa filosa]
MPLFSNAGDVTIGLRRNPKNNKVLPLVSLSLAQCRELIKEGHNNVTKTQFDPAIDIFRKVLHIIPLLILSSNEELREARQLVTVCREYINALRVRVEADKLTDEVRKFEMYCYFTHFDLQPAHVFSGLYAAIRLGYATQNYDTTAVLCRRLLELVVLKKVRSESSQRHVEQVEKVLKKCEAKGGDKDKETLLYKPHDFTNLCAMSLKPIPKAQADRCIKSPYCGSLFLATYDGQVSPVCQLVRIGASAQGLTVYVT